eukprot:EG_transcript_14431
MASSASYCAIPLTAGEEGGRPAAGWRAVLGAVAVCLGAGLAVGATVSAAADASFAQHRYTAPADVVYVNAKTGARLALRPSLAPLRAVAGSPAEALEGAAKVTVTGLLSVAAASTPASAVTQDARLADLVQAWNEDFGAQYGTWGVPVPALPTRAAPATALANARAPGVQIVQRVARQNDPVEQLVAEWNKDYGAQYGAWKPVKAPKPVRGFAEEKDVRVAQPLTVQAALASPFRWAYRSVLAVVGLVSLAVALAVIASRFVSRRREPLLAAVQQRLGLQEEAAVPGEFIFTLSSDGEMKLLSARREAWSPPAAEPALPMVEVSVAAPAPAERQATPPRRVEPWQPPAAPRGARKPQLASAMAGASGEILPQEYLFECDGEGEMHLRHILKASRYPL